MPGKVAIIANPMSGGDIRRLAARASAVTHEAKAAQVARIATGLDAMGVDEIMVMHEPARISTGALQWMPLRARVRVLQTGPVSNSAADTEAAVRVARDEGCDVIVALGGDGTHRVIAKAWPQAVLIALSTGTNNVFPVSVEATSAGVAAGLVACGAIAASQVGARCKLVHVQADHWTDSGVIDAVLLRRDSIGNMLPFDPERLAALVLTRAEPWAVGMSPIGGYLDPVGCDDECGLALRLGSGQALQVPVSPGLFGMVRVSQCERLPFDRPFSFEGPGVVAFDGDRLHTLAPGESAQVTVRRDGPLVIDVARCIGLAAQKGFFLNQPNRSRKDE
jgi:hypothetical protein